jgi:hypothetical protein
VLSIVRILRIPNSVLICVGDGVVSSSQNSETGVRAIIAASRNIGYDEI